MSSSPRPRMRNRRGLGILARLRGRTAKPSKGTPVSASITAFQARVHSGENHSWAALTVARECLAAGDLPGAIGLGYELAKTPGSAEACAAVRGVCHLSAAGPDQAWPCFASLVDPEVIAASAPEYFEAGFGSNPTAAERAADRLADLPPGKRPRAGAILRVARVAFSVGYVDCARRLVEAAATGDFGEASEAQAYELQRLTTWFPEGSRCQPPELLSSDVRFGVIDYKQPDNSSRNVGDFIQTLASIGHLVRNDNLSFVGDADLVAFVNGLREHLKPERRRDGVAARVQLLELQRDGNVYQHLPEPTWAIMFGWYLHPTFTNYNFPFNPAIRPIFASFHLNKPDALTPEGVEYLRRYGPVGCRDWQTVAMLVAAGVPAFFSGCVTTTVDTVFARSGPDRRAETGYVDARSGADDAENAAQSVSDIRRVRLPENLELAYRWVSTYHQRYRKVVTSRLHAYLPARSVGCEVDFEPANSSDPRFGGLIGIDDAAFEQIRTGLLEKLAAMTDLIFAGTSEDEVYLRWRELCAPDVARAESYLGSMQLPARSLPEVQPLAVAEREIVIDAAKSPSRVARLVETLHRLEPNVPIVAVGPAAAGLSVTCIDSGENHDLAMASVLAGLPTNSRALVLPYDAHVPGGLADLWNLDLGEAAIASRVDIRRNRGNLAALLRRISARQGPDWQGALTFLAATHRLVGHGKVPFDPRVSLIDVAGLGEAGWAELAGGIITGYGATWAEALNIVLAGANRPLRPEQVANVALEEVVDSSAVLHGFARSKLSPNLIVATSTGG